MSNPTWVVHKFGGTSLENAPRIRNAIQIVQNNRSQHTGIVVSAMAGITDTLLRILPLAESHNPDTYKAVDVLRDRHMQVAHEILEESSRETFVTNLKLDLADIQQVLHTVWLLQGYSQSMEDWLVGYGELWMARLFCAALCDKHQDARWLDARQFLTIQHRETGPTVLWQQSEQKLAVLLAPHVGEFVVVPGFIATTEEHRPTTLKRNGSDYTASIVGALVKAKEITIWSDVDGVLSADPRRVPEAVLLDKLSWQEATELAYFGAKVLHPQALAPAIRHNIPVVMRNSFHPDKAGTRIEGPTPHTDESKPKPVVKGFTTIDDMALINVEGTGMMGVPGIAQRLFGALREVGVSVVMISQASSEHSICFAVPRVQEELACTVVGEAFFREIQQNLIQSPESVSPCSILAAVGDNMADTPGVAAQFFTALGQAGVNVRAIAQGSSERNISAVIDTSDSTRALRAVHAGFYLSKQTLSVGLLGPGWIGRALLHQLETQAARLREEFHIDLRIRGIMDSKRMLLHHESIPLAQWQTLFEQQAEPADLQKFTHHIQADHLPHCAIIDCTANALAGDWYTHWLQHRIHVITPNKKAFSSSYHTYETLRALSRKHQAHLLYETTVGAALPVLLTLRDLLQTGDKIIEIEGVFSGTLSYLFRTVSPQQPFSEVVKRARQQGFTEPDPRDDLSGMDVARKVAILAREMGTTLEIADIPVQNLVPETLRGDISVDSFLQELAAFDVDIQRQLEEAEQAHEVLRYVGAIDAQGKAVVELRRYPKTHAFAQLKAGDNVFAFRTQRYDTHPIVIQGPGAGPDVTAGGVFADLLRLASRLGAPLQ